MGRERLGGKPLGWWARQLQTYLQQFVPIKDGSKNTLYDGDLFSASQEVGLQSGWSTNIPENAIAIAVRLGWTASTPDYICALQARAESYAALLARTQVATVGVDVSGVCPLHRGDCYLNIIAGSGNVNIVIVGYWM